MMKQEFDREAKANEILTWIVVACVVWLFCCFLFPDGIPEPQYISLPVSRIGVCPAPVGYRGTYSFDRSLIEWRCEVLRALPGSAKSDGKCFLINNCSIPGIEVKSKDKGILTVELSYLYGGPSGRIYCPTWITVE